MRLRALTVAVSMLAALLVPAGAAQADHPDCNGKTVVHTWVTTEESIEGTSEDDVIVGTEGDDIINGNGGNDTICGGGGIDIIDGGAGNDDMFGDAGDDQIDGGVDGTDLLVGLHGSDTLTGRGGRDTTYYYDVTAPSSGFAVDLDLSQGTAITTNGTDTLSGIEDVYGSPHNDQLIGNGANNYLDGDPGDDTVRGGAGDDHVIGDNVSVAGEDILDGGAGNDHLWGHGGNDLMTDPSGTNRFAGDAGNDTMTGGTGFDYLDYFCRAPAGAFCLGGVTTGQYVDLGDRVSRPMEPFDTDDSNDHGTDNISAGGFEGVRGSVFNDELFGRDVHANAFGDYFWPEAGDDVVDGRGGPDYVDYDVTADDLNQDCSNPVTAGEGLVLNLNSDGIPTEGGPITEPEVTGYLGSDQLANIEHAIGSPRRDSMTGTAGNNDLWGGCGDDYLFGLGGNDGLNGDDQNDVINAGAGDDKLIGGLGDDALIGGSNQDIVSYDGAANRVEVHLGAGTALGEGEDAIVDTEIIFGSGYNDLLVGGSSRDILLGGTGADELWGRGGPDVLLGSGGLPQPADAPADGADRVYGGTGTDTVDYSRAVARVVVNLATQRGQEGNRTDYISGIEVVQGSDNNDNLRGDAAANRLLGGAGGDTLNGGGGNDYVDGQGGSDVVYGGGGSADVVDFGYPAEANTSVNLQAGDAFVRNANTDPTNETIQDVEVVAGTSGRDVLRGTSRSDSFAGGGGNDALSGLAGNDFLFGQTGTDTFAGGTGTDVCNKNSGESTSSCETTSTAAPGWYVRVTGPREFRADGTDDFLDNLDAIIEELRRLHRRRLHR